MMGLCMPIRCRQCLGSAFRAVRNGCVVLLFAIGLAQAEEDRFGRLPQIIDIGYGVLATPMSVLGEVMRRDLVLRQSGADMGLEFRFHVFEKGMDSLQPLLDGRLDAAMPTDTVALDAIAKADIRLIGYVRQSFSAVVGPRNATMATLRGKRIGNAPGTSGHNTLMQGLAGVGLNENDVVLVTMNVRDMADALLSQTIDAFAAFEPTPSSVLKQHPSRFAALHRQISPAYFVVTRHLMQVQPEAATLLAASLHRSVRWMNRSRSHLQQASQWTLAAMRNFTGREPNLSEKDIAALTRSDLLDIAGAPQIPARESLPDSPLGRTFGFLMKNKKLGEEMTWKRVQDSIDHHLGGAVLANAKAYRLDEFSFDSGQ